MCGQRRGNFLCGDFGAFSPYQTSVQQSSVSSLGIEAAVCYHQRGQAHLPWLHHPSLPCSCCWALHCSPCSCSEDQTSSAARDSACSGVAGSGCATLLCVGSRAVPLPHPAAAQLHARLEQEPGIWQDVGVKPARWPCKARAPSWRCAPGVNTATQGVVSALFVPRGFLLSRSAGTRLVKLKV